MRDLRRLPTLDELAKDPALLEGLPRAVLADLFRSVRRLQVELHAKLLLGDAMSTDHAQPALPKALSAQRVAELLGACRVEYVHELCRRGQLRGATKPGKYWKIPPEAVSDYLALDSGGTHAPGRLATSR